VSITEFIGFPEPIAIYGLPDESAGIVSQALIQEFIWTQDGDVVH